MNPGQVVSFIWGVADLIRDTFKRGKYQDVILPLTVLRRLDAVLAKTKPKVLEASAKYKGKLESLEKPLRDASGLAFWNTSPYDFDRLLADPPAVAPNLRNYIAGFSQNMREVIERFDFDNTISKLEDAGLLFQVIERFAGAPLEKLDNADMGMVFEELIRKFNESLNENPGEHFTPRDVVRLMADLLLCGDEERNCRPGATLTIYDPCTGSGGMLTIARDRIDETCPEAEVHLFGQEVNPETYAICVSDLFMKDPSGRDADKIRFGSTLSNDRHADRTFDYLITNPPYGKDWKRDEEAVRVEHERGASGRFPAGVPRISDGQMLFLQHMASHMRPFVNGSKDDTGSRVAIILNGSPLFSGDAGSGESEIRRWILENDLLEALIALPEQLFYNTGIATYIWLLSNRKPPERQGLVQLVDARDMWTQMRKSLGDKRRKMSDNAESGIACEDHVAAIVGLYASFTEGDRCKILPVEHFGYRRITVERPLRLSFEISNEILQHLDKQTAFANLAISRKHDRKVRDKEEAAGRATQAAIRDVLRSLGDRTWDDRAKFERDLDAALASRNAGKPRTEQLKLTGLVRRAIINGIGHRDPEAKACTDVDGNIEPDAELRDTEIVPLTEDPDEYLAREVVPYAPDAWINQNVRDNKDGKPGKVGYEINLNREFYKYEPPRPLEEIHADLRQVESDITRMLSDLTR